MDQEVSRRRRRSYSAEFKAEAVAACRKPGASTAAAALERSINANVLRRWVVEAGRAVNAPTMPKALPAPPAAVSKEHFLPVPMKPQALDGTAIKVEVRRGSLTVSVQWPSSAVHECAVWLREVLK